MKMKMKIARPETLQKLVDFTTTGNGLVIGKPGVGKSYMLAELCESLDREHLPNLLLPIDQLGDGEDESVQSALVLPQGIITTLQASFLETKKCGIVIFDGYDAARNDEIQHRFLELIRDAVYELKDKWRVIVSVREYDARKSQELWNLFPREGETSPRNRAIPCRYFEIKPLDPEEVRQAFDQIPGLKEIWESGSEDLRQLLTIPFNLWLLKAIVSADGKAETIGKITTQFELLDEYWNRRVRAHSDCEARERLLTRLTDKLILDRALAAPSTVVVKPEDDPALKLLLSDDILRKLPPTEQNIAFSHNILFDFAVSLFGIPDETEPFALFLRKDPSRTLFLRPSLVFYSLRLWAHHRDLFWKMTAQLQSATEPPLRLFSRLVLPRVLVTDARAGSDLIDGIAIHTDLLQKAAFILGLLRAMEIEDENRRICWVEFLEHVSECIHLNFAWDLAVQSKKVLGDERFSSNTEVRKSLGIIGRRLLEWALQERTLADNKDWMDRFGGIHGVNLVAQTFETAPTESRALLERALALIEEPHFPIIYIDQLSDAVPQIVPHAPDLVEKIYLAVFTHVEESEEKTDFGGRVLPLSSTRRQEFHMCQYSLEKSYLDYLAKAPISAARMAVQCVNAVITQEHVGPYLNPGYSVKDVMTPIKFRDEICMYMADHSQIWGQGGHHQHDDAFKIASHLFTQVAAWADAGNMGKIESVLAIFVGENGGIAGYFWAKLFKLGAMNPRIWAPYLHELCVQPEILNADEVKFELGHFFESVGNAWTKEEARQVESAILLLPKSAKDADDKKHLLHRRNRFIARIPRDSLQTEDAKKLRAEMEETGPLPENTPDFSFRSGFSPYNEQERWKDQGVDPDQAGNRRILDFVNPLDKFRETWINKKPSATHIAEIIPALNSALEAVRSEDEAHQSIIVSAWTSLAGCALQVAHGLSDSMSSEIKLCCTIFIESLNVGKAEEAEIENSDSAEYPMWGVTARTESTEGLMSLSIFKRDDQVLRAIQELAKAHERAIRYNIARRIPNMAKHFQDEMWKLLENRTRLESDNAVQRALLESLNRLYSLDHSKSSSLIHRIAMMDLNKGKESKLTDDVVEALIGLSISVNETWAEDAFRILLEQPVTYAEALQHAVYCFFNWFLTPDYVFHLENKSQVDKALAYLSRIVDASDRAQKDALVSWRADQNETTAERVRASYLIIDKVISRLYFASDVNEKLKHDDRPRATEDQRKAYYVAMKPILLKILSMVESSDEQLFFAPTAHYFMELLNGVVKYDPAEILSMGRRAIQLGKKDGYHFDSLAVREIVHLAETILADHRIEVRTGQPLDDLLTILDIFADAGWKEASELVWRLDEIYR